MTVNAILSTLTHHGVLFVPLGYKPAFAQLANLNEVHGGTPFFFLAFRVDPIYMSLTLIFSGSPWGAGTLAGADGSRTASPLELEIASIQGKHFWETVSKVKF